MESKKFTCNFLLDIVPMALTNIRNVNKTRDSTSKLRMDINRTNTTTGSPARLRVDGSNLIDPATGEPVTLHGVNWRAVNFESNDGLDLETVLPEANLVRLVGILWDNGNPNKDCRTDDASKGFLSEECVQQMDAAINACQKHKTWVIITCRAAEAAGDGYPNDVFHDEDLAAQYETMWRLVIYLSCEYPLLQL